MPPTNIKIAIHPDPIIAPRYVNGERQLELVEAVITERWTEAGLPIVDLVLADGDGRRYYAMATGRIFMGIASAIAGVNQRNHGTPNP